MNLAINAVMISRGGGLNVLLGYLEAWRDVRPDFTISVYASRPEVLAAVAAVRPDVHCEAFAMGLSSGRHFVAQQMSLGRLVERGGADVVMTTNALLSRCRLPQLVHHQNLKRFEHDSVLGWALAGHPTESVKDYFARRSLRFSRANAYISDYLRRMAEKYVPSSAPYNHVVYNGLPKQLLQAARERSDGWQGEPRLMAIQAPYVHKDNPTLLRTLAELIRREPATPWRLSIAGEGDWSAVRELAASLGVADHVEFLGYLDHDQMDVDLRRAVCLVFPSVLEGFGLPLIEAMARRCPPVACGVTAMPEVVGDAGILVEPGNVGQFADAVMRLFHDRPHREELVQRGLARINEFTWEKSATTMGGLLEDCAKGRHR